MSSERADQPATPASNPGNPGQNPGQILASQREAMGWTVEQVADQLKLAVRQVVALEAGDYGSLPSPAVTRGFVRAYAKLMKLDPAPLVAQIAIDTGPAVDSGSVNAPRRAQPASFSQSSRFPSHGKRSKLPLGLIGAVVVVAAAGAAVWHFGLLPGGGQHADSSVAAPAAPAGSPADAASGSATATETLQNPSVPLISVPGPTGTTAPAAGAPAASTTPAGAAATPAQPAATTPAATAPAPAATPAATTAPAAAATPAAAPSGANALVLNVREDSWVEVRPARGGAALISRLVKGGSTETVNVDGPVRVVVGNPTGVTATLRGAPVALPPVPGKTISRVNLQ